MAQILAVLRPSDTVRAFTDEAIKKFKAMCGVSLEMMFLDNINKVAGDIESSRVAIFFIEEQLEKNEINLLVGCFDRAKTKPYIITCMDSYDALKKSIKAEFLGRMSSGLTQAFIFNCLRNLLSPTGVKIDVRYIRSIVTSVIDVINQNTKHQLVPSPIQEQQQQARPEEFTAIVALCGDGFLGSITVSSTKALLTKFATKMLFCEEKDVNQDMLLDLFAEVANQILGVIRKELVESGYKLTASMQAVVTGDQFWHASASNGRYYYIPFLFEGNKFDLTFCYYTYRTSILEIEEERLGAGQSGLDVRLVELALSSAEKMLGSNARCEIKRKGLCQLLGDPYDSNSLHLFHVAGWQGSVIMALDVPTTCADYFFKTMFGPEASATDHAAVNDLFGEMINQIGGEFLKKTKTAGYTFQRVFHGEFSGSSIRYLLKNSGLYVRFLLDVNGHELVFCFGINSTFAESFFNVWPYFLGIPKFNQQFQLQPAAAP